MKARFGTGAQSTLIRWNPAFDQWRRQRRPELKHGFRIASAGIASYVMAHILNLPQGYWAVFTALLVVQTSVGGSWKAAIDRLLGTLLGAAYGAAVAIAVPHGDPITLGVALAVSLLPLSVLAALNQAYRVAPVTAVILLLGNTGVTEGPVTAAILRSTEVALGGVCGVAVSLLVFPARAHKLLGEAANSVLEKLAALFSELLAAIVQPAQPETILGLHDAVRARLIALDGVVAEAARERRNHLSEDVDSEPVARTLRRLSHDLVLLGRVVATPAVTRPDPVLAEAISKLATTGSGYFRSIGESFANRHEPPATHSVDVELQRLFSALDRVRGPEAIVALRFCLQQLQQNLHDLQQRCAEFATARPRLAGSKT